MTKVLLKITLFDPKATGNSPANGIIEAAPSLRRHIDDETPADFIVLPARCTARLGDALTYTDNDDIEQTAEATPGVAWFWIDATTDGDYADLWYWSFIERTSGGKKRYCKVPATSPVDYGDLVDVDPDTYVEVDPGVPGWAAPLAAEVARAEAAESDLQAAIDAVEAGDVDSVAGLTGTVTASALKTALSLPTNAASDITTNATAIATETTRATTAEDALDTRLDSAEGTIAALPSTYAPFVPAIKYAPLPSGDTTGVTDVAVLNSEMLALSAAGGGVYQLARGTYWVNGIVAVPSNVILRGLGRAVTFIKQAAGANIYSLVRNANFTTSDTDIAILDLTIDGNGANQTTHSECLSVQGVTRLRLDLAVTNAFSEGAQVHGCVDTRVNIRATQCSRDGVVFDIHGVTSATCRNVTGFVETQYCGWLNRSTIASASSGAALPQTSITVQDATGWPTAGDLVVVATPASGIPVCNYLAYTGRTGNLLTGVTSSGTGTLATGDLIGVPQRSGCTIRSAKDFDLIVHSDSTGYHGTDITNTATFGKVRAISRLSGRYGVYCGLGPTDVDVDFHTTGSGYGGIGSEYTPPRADCRFVGISDGDQYGGVHDTSSGITHRGIIKNSQKHGVWLAGSDHCVIDLELAYNNGQLANNTYRDVNVSDNSGQGGHPAANSTKNEIRVGTNVATASNKVAHVVGIVASTQTYNRVSIGSIDGAVNPITISGISTSSTRNFVVPSGGVNPLGHYILPATGSFTIDQRNGRLQSSTMTGNVTISLSGGLVSGDELVLMLVQDATGSRTVTWSGSNIKVGGYTVTATASKRDLLRFVWDGTNWNLSGVSQNL